MTLSATSLADDEVIRSVVVRTQLYDAGQPIGRPHPVVEVQIGEQRWWGIPREGRHDNPTYRAPWVSSDFPDVDEATISHIVVLLYVQADSVHVRVQHRDFSPFIVRVDNERVDEHEGEWRVATSSFRTRDSATITISRRGGTRLLSITIHPETKAHRGPRLAIDTKADLTVEDARARDLLREKVWLTGNGTQWFESYRLACAYAWAYPDLVTNVKRQKVVNQKLRDYTGRYRPQDSFKDLLKRLYQSSIPGVPEAVRRLGLNQYFREPHTTIGHEDIKIGVRLSEVFGVCRQLVVSGVVRLDELPKIEPAELPNARK